jgi:hypothetical protein
MFYRVIILMNGDEGTVGRPWHCSLCSDSGDYCITCSPLRETERVLFADAVQVLVVG